VAVTCEHGTCTHGINYSLSEHVHLVVHICDNESCEVSESTQYGYQELACYSIVWQIVTTINGIIVWSRCVVPSRGANKTEWCLSIEVLYECAMNINRLQITLTVNDSSGSRLICAEIYCGNTVSVYTDE
jgi:hypothetical protein